MRIIITKRCAGEDLNIFIRGGWRAWSPNVTATHTQLCSQSHPAATRSQNPPCGDKSWSIFIPGAWADCACSLPWPGRLSLCNILHFSASHCLLHPTLPILKPIPTAVGCLWPGNSQGITLLATFLTSKSFFFPPPKLLMSQGGVRIEEQLLLQEAPLLLFLQPHGFVLRCWGQRRVCDMMRGLWSRGSIP